MFAITQSSPRAAFVEKSVSKETRRKYRSTVDEFFRFAGRVDAREVTPDLAARWRDLLLAQGRRGSTVAFKLSVLRSLFDYLVAGGHASANPFSTMYVSAPKASEAARGRALTPKEVRDLLAAPDRSRPEGARDYAMLLVFLRLGMRVSEVCSLRRGSISYDAGLWVVTCKVKGGREEKWPLPRDVKDAIDAYLLLDYQRRRSLGSGGGGSEEWLFQPASNYRTLVYDKALSQRQARNVVAKWGEYSGAGKLSPHDLRRTVVTKLLDDGRSYREVQMVTKHRDPKTVMLYDRRRENLAKSPVNTLSYEEG